MVQALDRLDEIAAQSFPGYVVRKDLARRFKGRYPRCRSTCLSSSSVATVRAQTRRRLAEGLAIVELQMRDRTVRPGEEELFKSRARERGNVKLIDIVTARLNPQTDSYQVALPSLRLSDVRVDPELVSAHERMLTGRLLRGSAA